MFGTVIEHQGDVVGFCILQPVVDEANLLLMAVDPSMQGKVRLSVVRTIITIT